MLPRSLRVMILLIVLLSPGVADADWPQWAGPERNFDAPTAISDRWPADGPKRLWQHDIGLGYASIAAASGTLYTLDRQGESERVLAFDAATGELLWQHSYDAAHDKKMRLGFGEGPHATPLVAGGRVFAVGITGILHALDAESGEVLWRKELWADLDGTFLVRGYATSPLLVMDAVVMTVGGEGKGFVAFDPATGEERWRAATFDNSQSSPILIEVEGRAQIVAFVNDEILGLDAESHDVLWRHPHKSGAAYNIATPIYDTETRRLFISSAYGGGTRALLLSAKSAEELWYNSKMKVQYTNLVKSGGHLYGTTGATGAVILACVDAEDGELEWRTRDVRRSFLLTVGGGRLLALSEDGELRLLEIDDQGVEIVAEAVITDTSIRNTPTVVDGRLYVRNEKHIMAFELPLAAQGANK